MGCSEMDYPENPWKDPCIDKPADKQECIIIDAGYYKHLVTYYAESQNFYVARGSMYPYSINVIRAWMPMPITDDAILDNESKNSQFLENDKLDQVDKE